MAFVSNPRSDPPSVSDAINELHRHHNISEWAIAPVERESSDRWRASVLIEWDHDENVRSSHPPTTEFMIWLQRKIHLDDWHFEGRGMTAAEQDRIDDSVWALGVGTTLGDDPLTDYHRLLKVLYAVAPDAPAVLDISSCSLHPGRWFREAAQSDIAPHPRTLFSIHSVNDPEGPDHLWLHTHGLLRCGVIEFEMFDIPPSYISEAVEMMEHVCIGAIEHGAGKARTKFSPGENIEIEWVPWPEAARKFSGKLGARDKDRDDYHRLPSGVIIHRRGIGPFASMTPPLEAFDIIRGAPIFYISNLETRRMRQLAIQRLPLLRKAFDLYRDHPGYAFFVKLGFPIEPSDSDDSREHLWFQIENMTEGQIFGKLLNAPIRVPELKVGEMDWRDLNLLTDWHLQTPGRRYDPDSITFFTWPQP